ncbi:MAG TPA: 1-acyl-sn-glycerol-3-phosphate acyltransferase [Gammaproteobacteria bacterium]|nr:1-acyl-sn-glycerol-3-phosphate acyltransferase [Gammaproteobacteria bacterium]
MTKIRSLIYFALFVVNTIVFGLLLTILGWIVPGGWSNAIANSWAALNSWLLKIICRLSYRVSGSENLPESAAIIMSKHQSTWETIALRHIVGGKQAWILKRELLRVPIFGWALASMSSIAINRNAGRKAIIQIIKQGTSLLNSGHRVMIFPEGTRTAPGEHGRYSMGGAVLAEKSGFPVIPIAHNAGYFWRRRDINKYPGVIDVVIGEPISTSGRHAKEIIGEVENWIENQMDQLPAPTRTTA